MNKKLPNSYHGLKVVHFSDLHYGSTFKIDDIKNMVKNINTLKPEIILFTGDLINNNVNLSKDELASLFKELNKLDPVISSYIIKGDHDYRTDYLEFLKNSTFILLENSAEYFYYNSDTPITIIGLESDLEKQQNIAKAFDNFNEEYYSILLVHEPDSIKHLKDFKVDLVLAGHSLNGQMKIPFLGPLFKIEGAKYYFDEKHIVNNAPMYISGGLGTNKYPFRLFNHPSFNFYRLYNQ
ncbi:MAG: metallophosphoesterase [Bacilli bacterium]|nr:metallophosphoesterase [Bacilli bacterium]